MSIDRKIRWLHLSDFHIGKDHYGQEKIFQYILQHVKPQGGTLDLIFITGDIAQSGLEEQYKTFQKDFISPMKQVCPSAEWFIVPGNHDIERSKVEAISRQVILKNKNKYFDPTESGVTFRKRSVLPGIEHYCRHIHEPKGWLDRSNGYFTWSKEFHATKVGVLGLNTAWLSMDDQDKGQLTPGKAMVEDGLDALKHCQIKIVLGHHPTEWFDTQEQAPIKALFKKFRVIYLHGHMHKSSVAQHADFLTLQAGSAFQAREDEIWQNRILWGDFNLETSQVELTPYTWSLQHQEWVVDSHAFHPNNHVKNQDCWAFDLPNKIQKITVDTIASTHVAQRSPVRTPHHQSRLQPIRWLHISDLHIGCPGREHWWQTQDEFEKSIRKMTQRLGEPDLIIITGDLTNKGLASEFEQLDRFLDKLLSWFDTKPILLPVPGNHDLVRPKGKDLWSYRILDNYSIGTDSEDIRLLEKELWEDLDASFINPLFRPYQQWFERRIRPQFEKPAVSIQHVSHFPGDYYVELKLNNRPPLGVVGLNSAWMQFTSGDYAGKLELPINQFHAALPDGGNSLDRFKHCPHLLLIHHPPNWLSRKAQKKFFESIYTPERFVMCLHGHMHQAQSETVVFSGGKLRYYFQTASLFGLEAYGTTDEKRSIGYTWCELSPRQDIDAWPLERVIQGNGQGNFVPNQQFELNHENHVRIRPLTLEPETTTTESVNLAPWLEDLMEQTSYINISGIGTGGGRGKSAHRCPIEMLYTNLHSTDINEDTNKTVGLAKLLSQHNCLVIKGQPGTGKTTFLRFVSSMLCRDRLNIPCSGAASWSAKYLGLSSEKIRVPVFLRISDLVASLTRKSAITHPNRECILDLILTPNEVNTPWRNWWRNLFTSGEAVLLLDGLDDVSDLTMREKIFAIFRDVCKNWGKSQMVVTSRPIDTEPLHEIKCHLSTIRPLDDNEINVFVKRWVAALHSVDDSHGGEAKDYSEKLLSAIIERPRMRDLAANPVMLTCLCVVHWNEGGLPEARARVYSAVLRWLISARKELRKDIKQQEISDWFAERAFTLLAFSMTHSKHGKRVLFDLEDAAGAVLPIVKRDFANIKAPQDQRILAREWLKFERLGSNIVEEVSGNRLRFWHLTFQEYLTALQLAWRADGEDDADVDWWPIVKKHLTDPQWREIVDMFPGCLLDEGGEGRVDRLLQRILNLHTHSTVSSPELGAQIACIVGRLINTLNAYKYVPPESIDDMFQKLLLESLCVFSVEGKKIQIKTRISVAEAIGVGGDPRFEHSRDNLLPVSTIDGFRLGRYPVTIREYQSFVENDGYKKPTYWSEEGWEFKRQENWENPGNWHQQTATPTRPVTHISWFEAEAYCRWLSEQWGIILRLPTQDEWTQAAKNADLRPFPWGTEEPDEEKVNFNGNVGAATPVGIYPTGNGPDGHADLFGNVWEWCADQDQTIPVSAQDHKRFGPRYLRLGNSWFSRAKNFSTFMHSSHAWNRDPDSGFRIATQFVG